MRDDCQTFLDTVRSTTICHHKFCSWIMCHNMMKFCDKPVTTISILQNLIDDCSVIHSSAHGHRVRSMYILGMMIDMKEYSDLYHTMSRSVNIRQPIVQSMSIEHAQQISSLNRSSNSNPTLQPQPVSNSSPQNQCSAQQSTTSASMNSSRSTHQSQSAPKQPGLTQPNTPLITRRAPTRHMPTLREMANRGIRAASKPRVSPIASNLSNNNSLESRTK